LKKNNLFGYRFDEWCGILQRKREGMSEDEPETV